MSHPAFPYEVNLPTRPSTRAEHEIWVDRKKEMSVWCSQEIVDHWGAEDTAFLFVFEKDMNRFKEHFGVEK
jgi:hypothetical protein